MPQTFHDDFMRLAIKEGEKNPYAPFGAVIVETTTGNVLATGSNDAMKNPTLHGEIQAINDWSEKGKPGNPSDLILYTTAEPCPMCMTAIIWAGFGGLVIGTTIQTLHRTGWRQVEIPCEEVLEKAPFAKITVVSGILEKECDELFAAAMALRQH